MAVLRTVFVILCALMENISSETTAIAEMDSPPPFFKSLGYNNAKDAKTLEEANLNQAYMFKYSEMLKSGHQPSLRNVGRKDRSDRRLKRVVGTNNYEAMKEAGLLDRRRNARLMESAAAKRRIRTQALRRNKLNSQSLKSHQQHSKKKPNVE